MLSLVVHLIALAMLFLLLQAEFVAAAQVIVYAGAVMVLYVFVVAYVGGLEDPLTEPNPALRALAPLFALALLVELYVAIIGSGLKAIDSEGPGRAAGFGSPVADRRAVPDQVPAPVRGRFAAAPGRRRRRARARPPRPGRDRPASAQPGRPFGSPRFHQPRSAAPLEEPDRTSVADGRRLVPRPVGVHLLHRAVGVLVRRSPLVILISLELMLNGGNLALPRFSRMTGTHDGQVFALS